MDINSLCIDCFKPTGGEDVCMNCGFLQSSVQHQLSHLYPHSVLNNRYIIGRVINNGGFGVVYKAYDMKFDNIVAIKELLPTQNNMVTRVPGNPDVMPVNQERAQQFEAYKQRFLDEARTMAKFNDCPGIVQIFDYFEQNNTAYLVMEFLDGITLREHLEKEQNPLDFETTIKIMTPIMEALKEVHKSNVIHRDVSTDNIFLTKDGNVKLIDFGASKLSNSSNENNSIVMKPGFTPPEQYRSNGKVGAFTDIYSTAAVIYNMLSGSQPQDSIDRTEKDNVQHLSKLGVNLPPYADKAIMKAMALREGARFNTMNDFILALKGKKKADYPEVELKKKKTRRAISFSAVLVVLIGAVFATFFVYNQFFKISEPTTDTTINVWVVMDEQYNENYWDEQIGKNFSKDFEDNASEKNKDVELTVKYTYISADKYKSELEKAYKNGNMPDIYISEYAPTDTLTKNDSTYTVGDLDTKFTISKDYSQSLNLLYRNLDKGTNALKKDENPVYYAMEEKYSDTNQIAVCYDTPVLYKNTTYATEEKTNLDALGTGLVTNPNAIVYAANAYGKDETTFENLYNSSTLHGKYTSSIEAFTANVESYKYYIGFASEYKTVSSKLANHIECVALPDASKSEYIYPMTFSISKSCSGNKKQTALRYLYYMIINGQKKVITVNNNPHYLPINQSFTTEFAQNSQGGFYNVAKSLIATNGESANTDTYAKAYEISKLAQENKNSDEAVKAYKK